MRGTNIKAVEEINRRKIELIVYASYLLGYSACNEGKLLSHRDCLDEIHRTIDLIEP